MNEKEEIKKLSLKELREKMDEVFNEANNIKYDMRYNISTDEEIIEIASDFAELLDEFVHVVIDNNEDCYSEYSDWFESCHDNKTSYRSSMMFREEELSGVNQVKDKTKRYFNYLVENLVLVNHMMMSLEFNQLREECSSEVSS